MATRITFLLDRTGSMEAIKDQTITGFNGYLDALRDQPDMRFTLLQFDSISTDVVCAGVPIADAPALTPDGFAPRAATPLIDACVFAIRHAAEGAQDGDAVIVTFMTDGLENSSVEHDWDTLNALIKRYSAEKWAFNFLGANIDAYRHSRRMGLSDDATLAFDAIDAAPSEAAYSMSAQKAARFAASGDPRAMRYTAAEKRRAGDRFVRRKRDDTG